jgi:DNA polymerase-4
MLAGEMRAAPYRLIGAGLSEFVNAEEAASDFFAGEERRALSGEKAIDALQARYGREAVISGRALRRKT